jgi:glycosyltransferase involved in cell wall biosynthesis
VRSDDSDHDVGHLATFCKDVLVVPMVRSRSKNVAALVESLITEQPAIIIRDRLPQMQALLTKLVRQQEFDVIHADQTSMAQYALYAQSVADVRCRPSTILDQHNALYLLVRRQSSYESWLSRPIWRREARGLANYERTICRQFDQILTVSREDKGALLALFSNAEAREIDDKITPIPICVDTSSQGMMRRMQDGKQIIHLGTMFWPPNVEGVLWFAEQVLPLIWRKIPEVRFIVAGKEPPSEVLALADRVGNGNIVVTGFVEDPQPLLERSQVFIVPVRAGGGMRVKIVDAWLWGLPVVSTTIGAEGLSVRPGENILLADDPEAFAAAIVRLFNDPTLAATLRSSGRRWVEDRYDYRRVYGQIDQVFARIG